MIIKAKDLIERSYYEAMNLHVEKIKISKLYETLFKPIETKLT